MGSGASRFVEGRGVHASHVRGEVLVAQVPGHAQRVEQEALGGLATRLAVFDGMDGPRGNPRLAGEFVLGPAACLARCANSTHLGVGLVGETAF